MIKITSYYCFYIDIGTFYEVSIRMPCNHGYGVMRETFWDTQNSKSSWKHNLR